MVRGSAHEWAEQFASVLAKVEAAPELVRLGEDERGRERFTTRAMLETERRMELGWVMAGVAGLVLLGWLASTLVLWWDMRTIAAARVEKARLQQEVAGLQATQHAWVKVGTLGKLEQCGPKARPCIRVDESAGSFGERLDYRVILGY